MTPLLLVIVALTAIAAYHVGLHNGRQQPWMRRRGR